MSEFHFRLVSGTHLSGREVEEACLVLSRGYSAWQKNPKNLHPADTDTSPEVYRKVMCSDNHEAVLYYEDGVLRGVFLHALSPEYDRYPLRKISYLAVQPEEKGYEPLKRIFTRYADFVRSQGEDMVITSDLDQATLNGLLEHAGFQEVVDRNETFFILSHLLQKKIFSFQKVNGDFVIDQIIKLEGKAVRRDKKLLKLQTTGYDFYRLYRDQQSKRLRRSISPARMEILRAAFGRAAEGVHFISAFDGTITLDREDGGGFNPTPLLIGENADGLRGEIIDEKAGLIYLLPGSDGEMARIASRIRFRPGFFDFLFFCLKALGSVYVISGALPGLVGAALERPLAPGLPLCYRDLIESVMAPDIAMIEGTTKRLSDGSLRTAYRAGGRLADLSGGEYTARKDLMVESVLSMKGDTAAPVVYLCSDLRDAPALARLYDESRRRSLPVIVFDFGKEAALWVNRESAGMDPEANPYFSVVGIRDFYQIPVMLEETGLTLGLDEDFLS